MCHAIPLLCVPRWISLDGAAKSRAIGGIVVIVAGIPLDIGALPITLSLSAMDHSPDGGGAYIVVAPSLATGFVIGNVIGFVPWLGFGWWENEKYEQQRGYSHAPEERREKTGSALENQM